MKLSVLAVFLIGVCFGAAAAENAAEAAAAPREILFGTDFDYNRPEGAKTLLYESGLNCVRITGGGYGWAVNNHREWSQTLAGKGIKTYLQLGSHYPSGDYFPLHDAWLVDQNGKTGIEDRQSWAIRYDHSCWPQLSYAHQKFRDMLEKDFTNYLQSFPAAEHLAGVILHNEPGMHWLEKRIFDYSAPSIAAFREWLPTVHTDIAVLNRRWGSDFSSFAAVTPPVKPNAEHIGPWLDWRRFQVQQIAKFMAWESAFIGRIRSDLVRTTNLDGPTNNWYAIRCADIEAYSRKMDTVGIDIYPSSWTDRAFVAYAADQLLGVAQGRRAHVLECEVFSNKASEWQKATAEQRADFLRSELWTIYGHGADGVLLWGFSRSDSFSITDGEWNPRVAACRDIAYQLRMLALGNFRRAPASAALCVDPDAYIRANALDGTALSGGSAIDHELHGIHAALRAAGVQCDVIMTAQLAAAVKKYRAVIIPSMPLMDSELAAVLRSYVENGGMLIVGGQFAEFDRWGAPLTEKPGCGLAAVFAGAAVLPGAAGNTAGQKNGKFGRGWGVRLADGAGGNYLGGKDNTLPAALAAALRAAGVVPAVQTVAAGTPSLDVSLLADRGNRLLTAAVQFANCRPIVPATGVKVSVPDIVPAAAFAFPATAVAGDVVRSGPVKVFWEKNDSGCTVELGTVKSALPVLLVQNDCQPLLALAVPAKVKSGADTVLTVTCHNPAAADISGTLTLTAPGVKTSAPVQIPAWGSAEVKLTFAAPAAAPRLPLQVKLTAEKTAVDAIPVNITVE